ncbi:hypothetical protein HBH53_122510 [Parastagonospora nodorum]|nr:hypothetical protein HBH53_122510 [Parastagonospora nodorum]KAH4002278.1 hypothetical protein HBI10_072070 [Parastagonospora nodorum]KAH4018090.1 hypothetical protein HBI13_139080 [Parastagonospora nodorum]KAH4164138.1 hypothetical protein HBH43_151410 [Parastagonospora nodorum]KAH4807553.1 hypothetical protein HBH61_130970 [Parastagonospora nodorum]
MKAIPNLYSNHGVNSPSAYTSQDDTDQTGLSGSNPASNSAATSQRADNGILEEMLRKKTATKMTLPSHENEADDWETRAMKGIRKKNLSLSLNWGEKTWINKSNCLERLKLLRDDGVDISPLHRQDGKQPDSVAITKAVIAQVNVRKNGAEIRDGAQSALGTCAASPRQDEDVREAAAAVVSPVQRNLSTPSSRKRSREGPSGLIFPSSPLYSTENGSARKRLCIDDIREEQQILMAPLAEELYSTWANHKQKVLTEIFTTFPEGSKNTCRISIAFPSQTAEVAVPGNLELTSSGYDNIMLELRTLADSTEEDGTLSIRNGSIRVFANVPLRTIIEGQHRHVTSLLKRLTTPGKGLTHMAIRDYDDNGSRRIEGDVYELSIQTQGQINGILELLEARCDTLETEVQVRWVNIGKKGYWPKKMYD